jgi:Endonuclease V (EC 3.1.21.-)
MELKMLQRHPGPRTIEEAIAIQEQLRSEVITENQLSTVRYIAGVDVGYDNADAVSQAAVTVLSFPELQLQQQAVVRSPTAFPYVPGFLSFREVPAVLDDGRKNQPHARLDIVRRSRTQRVPAGLV